MKEHSLSPGFRATIFKAFQEKLFYWSFARLHEQSQAGNSKHQKRNCSEIRQEINWEHCECVHTSIKKLSWVLEGRVYCTNISLVIRSKATRQNVFRKGLCQVRITKRVINCKIAHLSIKLRVPKDRAFQQQHESQSIIQSTSKWCYGQAHCRT